MYARDIFPLFNFIDHAPDFTTNNNPNEPLYFTTYSSRFTKSAGCIISEGVSKETVKNAADTSKVKLRGKFDVFAETLVREEVPLLVFSAGVGQIIERVSTSYTC